jgi:hypothetical protein
MHTQLVHVTLRERCQLWFHDGLSGIGYLMVWVLPLSNVKTTEIMIINPEDALLKIRVDADHIHPIVEYAHQQRAKQSVQGAAGTPGLTKAR